MLSLVLFFELATAQNNTNTNTSTNTSNTSSSTASIFACLNCANTTSISSSVQSYVGTSTVSVVCTSTVCIGRQTWRQGTITITGATTAQLQALQAAITAGSVSGVPKTAVVYQNGVPVSGTSAVCPTSPAINVCLSTTECQSLLQLVVYTKPTCCNGGNNQSKQSCPGRQVNQSAFQSSHTVAEACALLLTAGVTPSWCATSASKKGLLGLLGLLGLIPLLLCLLLLCLCCLRRKKRQQAVKFGEVPGAELAIPAAPIVAAPAAIPVPAPVPVPCAGAGVAVPCNGYPQV